MEMILEQVPIGSGIKVGRFKFHAEKTLVKTIRCMDPNCTENVYKYDVKYELSQSETQMIVSMPILTPIPTPTTYILGYIDFINHISAVTQVFSAFDAIDLEHAFVPSGMGRPELARIRIGLGIILRFDLRRNIFDSGDDSEQYRAMLKCIDSIDSHGVNFYIAELKTGLCHMTFFNQGLDGWMNGALFKGDRDNLIEYVFNKTKDKRVYYIECLKKSFEYMKCTLCLKMKESIDFDKLFESSRLHTMFME
jgi:hypothetical protein